jgi:hypothetical protein
MQPYVGWALLSASVTCLQGSIRGDLFVLGLSLWTQVCWVCVSTIKRSFLLICLRVHISAHNFLQHYLSEISRVQCRESWENLLTWKISYCIWPYNQKRGMVPSGPLDFGLDTSLTWVCYTGSFTKWPQKLLVLSGVLRRRLCHRSRPCRLLCHLGHMTQQIPWAWGVRGR